MGEIICHGCGKEIGHLYSKYFEEKEKLITKDNIFNNNINTKDILNNLKLYRYCCRRMLISYIDIYKKLNNN